MNAPKKVWMRVNMAPKRLMEEKLFDDDIAYIRADLVDGLVEALEELMKFSRFQSDDVLIKDARAALKELEEE